MYIVVFATFKDIEEAKTIVAQLIYNKEIACANILPSVDSVFFWSGNVCNEKEVFAIMKSKKSKFRSILKTIKSIHSYSVPEVIAIPIIDGNEDYLGWIKDSVGKKIDK